jgi:hypothetical protein
MPVDTALHIAGLDPTNPTGDTSRKEADDNFRHIKEVLKRDFANVAGAVTASHAELNQLVGVTSPIQTQIDGKISGTSPALTGIPTAPTAAPGTNSTQIATMAAVLTAVANVNATSGVTASVSPSASFSLTDGQIVAATNSGAVSVDASSAPVLGAVRGVHFDNARLDNTINWGSRSVIGMNGATFSGVMTVDQPLPIAWRWFGDYWRAI